MKLKDFLHNSEFIKLNNYNFSNEFNDLLKINEDFRINKLIEILLFLEKLMFIVIIKNDKKIINCCSEILTEKNKSDLNAFYKDEKFITKEILSIAIRRYITRYLIRENDLEKIKNSKRNFIKYLYIEDLWNNEINENKTQKDNEIKVIKNMNIFINQIIPLYDFLGGDNYINEELNELKEDDNILNNIIINNNQMEIKKDIGEIKTNGNEPNPEPEPEEDVEVSDDTNSYVNKDDDDDERD